MLDPGPLSGRLWHSKKCLGTFKAWSSRAAWHSCDSVPPLPHALWHFCCRVHLNQTFLTICIKCSEVSCSFTREAQLAGASNRESAVHAAARSAPLLLCKEGRERLLRGLIDVWLIPQQTAAAKALQRGLLAQFSDGPAPGDGLGPLAPSPE